MRAFFRSLPIIGLALTGCQQSVTPAPLRSLAGSERVSLVCRDFNSGEGRDLRACPDPAESPSDHEDRRPLALITQTIRGEVAVVDLQDEKVLDANPWLPGKEFLTIGANPTAIVSTPGGTATFVTVGEPGMEAIYALPTTCIGTPVEGERTRDALLWAACRLPPGRPGELAIVTDAMPSVDGDSSYRKTCLSDLTTEDARNWHRLAMMDNLTALGQGNPCPANLAAEEQIAPVGRRKLLVTLPDLGKIAIFDAQALLNLGPGTFQDCIPDAVIPLGNQAPSTPVVQPLPPDLQTTSATGQVTTTRSYSPDQITATAFGDPQPAGIAISEGTLYVADSNAPLIHSIDLSDVCAAHEDPSKALRPLSFDYPSEPVYTRGLSVSSRTLAGAATKQRFLYAIETGRYELQGKQNDGIGSVMVFDLADGASPAPIVRSHSREIAHEPADRLRFESPVKQVRLITRDAPIPDEVSETAEVGVLCDPYPSSQSAGTRYRTNSDYDKGAGPRKLRGVFGVLALGSGVLSAIDIEDWDAPCRRPVESNSLATGGVDWRGCAPDPVLVGKRYEIEAEQERTVTDEASCNIVEPHRARSASYFTTNGTVGTHAPSLASFPRLSSKENGDLPTGEGDIEHKHPQMLAVAFPPNRASEVSVEDPGSTFVYVNNTRYSLWPLDRNRIERDPALASSNSLLLPLEEPRVYSSQEEFSATYEGIVVERASGLLQQQVDDDPGPGFDSPLKPGEFLLRDRDARFCSNGVEDQRIALETAKKMLPPGSPHADLYASRHADFVVLTNDFDASDPYYQDKVSVDANSPSSIHGNCSAQVVQPGDDRPLHEVCKSLFGTKEEPRGTSREFIIKVAQDDELLLTPRDAANAEALVAQVRCCFLNVTSYQVRAGNQWIVRGNQFYHQMAGSSESACIKGNDPGRARFRGRAHEIASSTCQVSASNEVDAKCPIGPRVDDDVCVVDHNDSTSYLTRIDSTLPADCVFENLKGRFAIYRGMQPSKRDMAFKWKVSGGFSMLASPISTTTYQQNVVPTDIVYSEALDALVIVDGQSGGLNLVGMTQFAPLGQPYL